MASSGQLWPALVSSGHIHQASPPEFDERRQEETVGDGEGTEEEGEVVTVKSFHIQQEQVQQKHHALPQRLPGQHGLSGQVIEEGHQLLQDVDGGCARGDGRVG